MSAKKITVEKVIIVIVVICLIAAYGFLILDIPDDSPEARRVRLLCETDHEALLLAGREILAKAPKNLMRYAVGSPVHDDGIPVPKEVQIPRVIRRIMPYEVLINLRGYVVLHMAEDITNYGVKIYPEGFKSPNPNFRFGDRELLPGLWYYDYRYSQDPAYNKKIDQVLQTGKWPEPNDPDFKL